MAIELTDEQRDTLENGSTDDLFELADELGIEVPDDVEPYGRYVRKFLRARMDVDVPTPD